jgi:hypothetical protein
MLVEICIGPDCMEVGYEVGFDAKYEVVKGYDSPFGQS